MMLRCLMICYGWLLIGSPCQALSDSLPQYIDYFPHYTPWRSAYILDKIEYTPEATVLHCQWRCPNATVTAVIFPTPENDFAWLLEDLDSGRQYPMRYVRNVQRNGALLFESFEEEPLYLVTAGRRGHTVFRFEIHFPVLEEQTTRADLLAGKGNKYHPHHFNCFDIELKSWRHPPDPEPAPAQPLVYRAEPTPALTPSTPPVEDTRIEPITAPYQPTGDAWSSTPPCGQALVLEGLRFLDDKAELDGSSQARAVLQSVADYLRRYPTATATLHGHTDVFGDADRNLDLSERRAKTIQRLLLQYGISDKRLDCQWYGIEQPLYPEGNALNRRVEIEIHCP